MKNNAEWKRKQSPFPFPISAATSWDLTVTTHHHTPTIFLNVLIQEHLCLTTTTTTHHSTTKRYIHILRTTVCRLFVTYRYFCLQLPHRSAVWFSRANCNEELEKERKFTSMNKSYGHDTNILLYDNSIKHISKVSMIYFLTILEKWVKLHRFPSIYKSYINHSYWSKASRVDQSSSRYTLE